MDFLTGIHSIITRRPGHRRLGNVQFERGLAQRVQAENKVYVGEKVGGGIHVKVLLQPPLGACVVELSSARKKEEEVVMRMRPELYCHNPAR